MKKESLVEDKMVWIQLQKVELKLYAIKTWNRQA